MHLTTLHVGGLVAVGFDTSGNFLLTVSHAGRGVFDIHSRQGVARDYALAYPIDGLAVGIGPLANEHLSVIEIDDETGTLTRLHRAENTNWLRRGCNLGAFQRRIVR